MCNVTLSWKELKSLFANYPYVLRRLVYYSTGYEYKIFLHYRGVTFQTTIDLGTPDAADFENNYLPKLQPEVDERGLQIISPTIADFPGNTRWLGELGTVPLIFQAQPGIENFFDIPIPEFMYIRGGRYSIMNPADVGDDDYIEFSIIDLDVNNDGVSDVLGIQVPAGGFVELAKFIKKWWVRNIPSYEFKSESAELLAPGLYLRIGYMSTGSVPINFKGFLMTITDLVEVP